MLFSGLFFCACFVPFSCFAVVLSITGWTHLTREKRRNEYMNEWINESGREIARQKVQGRGGSLTNIQWPVNSDRSYISLKQTIANHKRLSHCSWRQNRFCLKRPRDNRSRKAECISVCEASDILTYFRLKRELLTVLDSQQKGSFFFII